MNKTKMITEDNNYIIELERKQSIFNPDRAICNITFKTIYDNILASINISDIEIVNFIDNLYAFFELGSDIICAFTPNTTDSITYSIGLNVVLPSDINSFMIEENYTKDILTLYSYNAKLETSIKILSFEITNSAEHFVDLLYDTFIEPNNEQMKKYLLNL